MEKRENLCSSFWIVFAVSCTVIVLALAVAYNSDNLSQQAIYNVLTSIGSPELLANTLQYLWGLFGWIGVFTVCYWTAGCARRIFVLGPKTYIKESVLVYRIYPWMKKQNRENNSISPSRWPSQRYKQNFNQSYFNQLYYFRFHQFILVLGNWRIDCLLCCIILPAEKIFKKNPRSVPASLRGNQWTGKRELNWYNSWRFRYIWTIPWWNR